MSEEGTGSKASVEGEDRSKDGEDDGKEKEDDPSSSNNTEKNQVKYTEWDKVKV